VFGNWQPCLDCRAIAARSPVRFGWRRNGSEARGRVLLPGTVAFRTGKGNLYSHGELENSLNFHKPLPASLSRSNVGMIVCRRLFFFGCADLAAGEQQHGGWRFPSLASNAVPAVVVTDRERKSRRLYAAPICSSRVPVRSGDSELEDLPYPATIIATIEDRAEMGSGGCGRENLYCNTPGKSGPRRKPVQLMRRADIRRSRRQGL